MASEPYMAIGKPLKQSWSKRVLYHRFFVSLLIFIVVSLALSIVLNVFSGSSTHKDYHEPVKLSLKHVPKVIMKRDAPLAVERYQNCSYWDCFNVYRCGRGGHDKITIYIYPLNSYVTEEGLPMSTMSREFYIILDTIRKSRYYTSNPEEACLLVPSIDTLNQNTFSVQHVSQILQSLPYWNDGENHVIFNMLPGSAPNYNTVIDVSTGKAIIAGAGFDTWTFRYGFDISIPVFSESATKINETQPKAKSIYIVSTQTNLPSDYLAELRNLAMSSKEFVLLESCIDNVEAKRCEYVTSKTYNYPQILKESTFCLVVRSARLTQAVLMDILASQCIPVVIADSIVMPFNSHIDWELFSLFIPENSIRNIVNIVRAVSEERRAEMFWQLRWVYDRYLASIEKIVLTSLEIINEKVFPLAARMYEDWNLALHLYGPTNPLFLPHTAPKAAGFTAVVLTYDRPESLFALVRNLALTPSLVLILVVWNNQEKPPPPPSEWPAISKPLKVIRTTSNRLSNRFYPYDEIQTECQLTIDDDIVMLTPDELEFGFDVWREFPSRIVGFPSRLHVPANGSGWRYHSEWTNEISMVLTGAAFHHKLWSWYYTRRQPAALRRRVDEQFNCEDIAMNFLVANVTGLPPVKVTPRKKFKCPSCPHTSQLSAAGQYMSRRSECITRFAREYGRVALRSVEWRADPLQLGEGGGGVPVAYPGVGRL